LKHAKLYQSSMCELVQRLKSDTYGDIYNCPETEFIGGAGQSEAKAVNDIIEGWNVDIMKANEIEETKIPDMEYELEMEDGNQVDLTKEQVTSYVSGLTAPTKSTSCTPKRKRKHIEDVDNKRRDPTSD